MHQMPTNGLLNEPLFWVGVALLACFILYMIGRYGKR